MVWETVTIYRPVGLPSVQTTLKRVRVTVVHMITSVLYISLCYPISEMTYTVSSGTLNPSIPYHTIPFALLHTQYSRAFSNAKFSE